MTKILSHKTLYGYVFFQCCLNNKLIWPKCKASSKSLNLKKDLIPLHNKNLTELFTWLGRAHQYSDWDYTIRLILINNKNPRDAFSLLCFCRLMITESVKDFDFDTNIDKTQQEVSDLQERRQVKKNIWQCKQHKITTCALVGRGIDLKEEGTNAVPPSSAFFWHTKNSRHSNPGGLYNMSVCFT